MQNLLITPDEVIELAFSTHDQIDSDVITDSRIEAAQLKFIAPALHKLYPPLIAGVYDDFLREYIKPALAYFIKYNIFLCLSVRIGNDGIIRVRPTDSTPVDSSEIGRLRRECRETAELFLKKALDYLKKNAGKFPEFQPDNGKEKKRIKMNGGLII